MALFTYARMGMPIYTRAFQDLLPPTISLIDRYERSGWLAECEDSEGNGLALMSEPRLA